MLKAAVEFAGHVDTCTFHVIAALMAPEHVLGDNIFWGASAFAIITTYTTLSPQLLACHCTDC